MATATMHAPRHPHLSAAVTGSSSTSASTAASSTTTSAASSNHSPFRRVHRANYAPPPPSKSSSSASAAAAAAAATSSTAVPRHHAPPSTGAGAVPAAVDTYYGHEDTSKLCARFVSHTFNCPEIIPLPSAASAASSNPNAPPPRPPPNAIPNTLAHFVAYALHRTRLHPSVVFTALALLHRLKARFPAARGSSGHRLFLAAYMLASKVVCDDTYSNKSWAVVGQGMFALREINQMEREMLGYLEWGLNVCREDLGRFEREVRRVYGREQREGSWGRGVEMRLTAGVGGYPPPSENGIEEPSSLTLLNIPASSSASGHINAVSERSPHAPHQLPTPTDAGPAAVPVSAPRPVLPPISTMVGRPAAYPSPPSSPTATQSSATVVAGQGECDSACSSASTSPVDGEGEEAYDVRGERERESPSPASSEDSDALPTPPNSALSAHPHAHRAAKPHQDVYRSASRGAYVSASGKMGKAHSVPGFHYAPAANGRGEVGRASAPPTAASASVGMYGMGMGGMEADGDAVMSVDLDGASGTYYATAVHAHSARKTAPAPVQGKGFAYNARGEVREGRREEGRREEGRREERERERRMRTYTVPCAW